MKACVLEDIGKLECKDVKDPVMKPGEVLLRVRACGVCSSDIPRIFETGTYHFPTIPGHEFSGEIIDAYDEENRVLIGKRAVVFPLIPCRECPSCKEEEYARCDNYNYFGSRCDGGMAELLAVPVWNLVFFSDALDFSMAALCEPASVAGHAVDRGGVKTGESVVVIGTGTVGILEAFWAKAKGATKVVVAGRSEEKLDFIKGLGFNDVINTSKQNPEKAVKELTGGRGADVSLECVGNPEAVSTAVVCTKKGGRVVLTGNPSGDITFEKAVYWKILRNELSVIGTWNSSFSEKKNDWKKTISYMEKGLLPADSLVTHRFPLSDTYKALDVLRDRSLFSIKAMILP